MNTFWLKMAALVVVIVGLIVVVKILLASKPKPQTQQKTFYDVVQEDDARLRAEPNTRIPVTSSAENAPQAEPQFKELSPEDQTRAEQLFEMALAQRKMGRLPGMTYKLMVDYCRQIIEQFPDTTYAFKARRMLAEIPPQKRKLYNITDDEINPKN